MAGFKEYVLEFRLADGTMHSIPFRVPLGEDGEDGGYYTPVAREVSDRDVEITFVPSKPGMPVIAPFIIKGGEPGVDGTVSFDELTEAQRESLKGDPFRYEDFTAEQLAALKGAPGDDYVLTQADKAEIAEMAAELVEVPEPDSGGNADYVGIEPAEDDMPKVFLTGSEFGNMTTAKNEVNMGLEYISKTDKFKAAIKIKFQGNTSLTFPKKNFTIKMYTDDTYEDKLKKSFKDWNHSGNKYVLKANWIDHAHARNIISARLWGEVVASRPDYDSLPVEMRNAPNNGAIDGFPVKLYVNGKYEGVYTWNVGKDDWMWGMDEDNANHVLMCAETNNDGAVKNTPCNFRALWSGTDENNWTVEVGTNSTAVKTALNNLIQFVMDNDGDAFRNGINNYLDIQSAIDYYIFQYEICGLDGLAKNMLLATYDGARWICGAYDMDATFGLYWNGSKFVSAQYRCPEDYQETYSLLWERIEANFLPELKARQAELRKTVLSYSNIVTHFERFMDIIGLDLYAEDLTIYTGIPSGSTNNIKQIRNFIRDRQTYVDAEFAKMGEESTDPDQPDTPDNPEPSEVPCTGISLDKNEITFNGKGTQTITATVTPTNTTDAVVWVSSAPSVASITVEENVCTVQSVNNGNAVITVTCGEHSATCAVSVSGIEVVNILKNVTWQYGSFNGNTGADITTTNEVRSNAIDVSAYAGNNIMYQLDANGAKVGFWDESGAWISSFYSNNSMAFNKVPDNAATMRLSTSKNTKTFSVRLFDPENNLLDFSNELISKVYSHVDGALGNDNGYNCQKIALAHDGYLLTYGVTSGALYDANDAYVGKLSSGGGVTATVVTEITNGMASAGFNYQKANSGVAYAVLSNEVHTATIEVT